MESSSAVDKRGKSLDTTVSAVQLPTSSCILARARTQPSRMIYIPCTLI